MFNKYFRMNEEINYFALKIKVHHKDLLERKGGREKVQKREKRRKENQINSNREKGR